MIDMTDIPASWAGRGIRVHRPGVSIEGVVVRIECFAEITTVTRMGDGTPARQNIHRIISVSLDTPEGELDFRDIKTGGYNIELIEEN